MSDLFGRIEELLQKRYEGWEGAKQFDGSGERLRRLVDEMCWPLERIDEELEKCFRAVYDEPYDEMLVSRHTNIWTLCPHHLLPCCFKVHIGYIPIGKVLGLSKFTRIALILAKRPIMQEQYTRGLADILMEKLEPEGVGVFVVGRHGCMGCRGVQQPNVEVVTSTLKGSFKDDPTVREEFYSIVRG